ncbi:MAG: calcium/sodium antiporter [Arenicella sp.]|jgi:cation:H+ antiporter|nr:calcium/sodium antiporter [Arenicella sp.]HAU68470.1 calcium/sodium antiporter [Gammaproteobacteria bacterium]
MIDLALPIVAVLFGFVVLMKSADLLVDNAVEFALRLGISTFLVGVIIIGFGTSAPEMFVSAMASLEGKGNLAVGNALGSNVTNIGLVLGLAAFINRISVSSDTAIADIPVLIITGVLGAYFVLDGELTALDGAILLIVLGGYLFWSAQNGKTTVSEEEINKHIHSERSMSALISLLLISIFLLLVASRVLVFGAVSIAEFFGVSDLIIGLTVVAIGTSLPELAAAIAAARKNAHDMIIGNIIGSNVFNILAVLGITGVIQSTAVETEVIWRDFPVMLGMTVVMLLIAYCRKGFGRIEGIFLLAIYLGYISYLIASSTA